MKENDISVRIGGQAGDGSLTTGDLLAKALKRVGLWVVTTKDFPSRIRGGHTNYTIRAKHKRIYGPADYIDFLVAFDYESFPAHTKEITSGGVVLYDNSIVKEIPEEYRRDDLTYYGAPVAKLAREELGLEVIKNTVLLGVLGELLGIPNEIEEVIEETFLARKGRKVFEKNVKAFRLGKNLVGSLFNKKDDYRINPITKSSDRERLLLAGNYAIALGAIVAGCRFYAGYPITPATEILEFLAEHLPAFGGAAIQVEDEISAINMVLGASFAGVRAMTATSGPGLALMTEAMSLSGMAEIPAVIVDCQRAGPSTGLPTKSEQGDLNHAIFGGHGDFPRIVIAPGHAEEAFYLIQVAFNLAEKYQLPVIFLTEQSVAQNKQTVLNFEFDRIPVERGKLLKPGDPALRGKIERYGPVEDSIPPRPRPGLEGGLFLSEGNEHDFTGHPSENPEIRKINQLRRNSKVKKAVDDVPKPEYEGHLDSSIGIIGMGATYGPIVEAMEELEEKKIKTHYLRLVTLWPFPEKDVKAFIKNKKKIFVVEQNATAQLRQLIQRFVGPSEKIESITKFNGRSFVASDIYEKILSRVEEVLV